MSKEELKKQREKLIKKWEDTGLLDGIGSMSKSNMSELLESEAKQLLREKCDKEKKPKQR